MSQHRAGGGQGADAAGADVCGFGKSSGFWKRFGAGKVPELWHRLPGGCGDPWGSPKAAWTWCWAPCSGWPYWGRIGEEEPADPCQPQPFWDFGIVRPGSCPVRVSELHAKHTKTNFEHLNAGTWLLGAAWPCAGRKTRGKNAFYSTSATPLGEPMGRGGRTGSAPPLGLPNRERCFLIRPLHQGCCLYLGSLIRPGKAPRATALFSLKQ